MRFELIGSIVDREVIAAGVRIREREDYLYHRDHFVFVDFRWRSGRSCSRYRERHDLRQPPAGTRPTPLPYTYLRAL